ncbi:uncharacterized protein LOC144653240 [Oculina patagonica]
MTSITESGDNSEVAISRMETIPLISTQTAKQSRCQKFNSYLSNLACFSFFLLLLWQFIGSVLYFMRAYHCCLKERHATFRCTNFTEIPYSQELELAWLASQEISVAILIFSLNKVPGFLGYSVIFKKSVRLPAFWSLLMLNVIYVIGFGIIMYLNFHEVSSLQICLIIVFCLYGIALLGMVCVLNFTPVNQVKNSSGFLVFMLFKLTIVALFVQVFIIFMVGTVQFAFKVTGLDEVGTSADFVTLFRKLREFPQVVFYYKIAAFIWRKLFLDNRNVLSHCQLLKLRNDLLKLV